MKYITIPLSRDQRLPNTDSVFHLGRVYEHVSKIHLRFTCMNTLHNVQEGENTIHTNTGTVVIPSGFYQIQGFIDTLGDLLAPATITSYDAVHNTVKWNLPPGFTIDASQSTANRILGFHETTKTMAGTFRSRLNLSGPPLITLSLPDLGMQHHPSHMSGLSTVISMDAGYLTQQTYDVQFDLDNMSVPDLLKVHLYNPVTGNPVTDLHDWTLALTLTI